MNNKFFRSIMAVIVGLCLMMGVNVGRASAQSSNVQLYSAQLQLEYNNVNITGYNVTGYVYVNNLAYDKNVTIHYTYDGTNWLDQPATYYKTLADGSEVWKFSTPFVADTPVHQYKYNCQFAIKYEVDGNTYWDNNNGNNYFVQVSTIAENIPYALGKSVITRVESGRSSNSVYGQLALKNLAYDKVVKVHYTTNNWQTYSEVNATYNQSVGNGLELWTFNTISSGSEIPWYATVEYAISYSVNGVTYWDNNFEYNYTAIPVQDPNQPN